MKVDEYFLIILNALQHNSTNSFQRGDSLPPITFAKSGVNTN